MQLPLLDLKCSCGYETECAQFGINDNTIKGLIYLMGSQQSQDFALSMAQRKLRRSGKGLEGFTEFVDKVKERCPYYRHS